VQTFLTHPSFSLTASTLDNKRLGKQRVETKQILETNLAIAKYKAKFTPFSTPSNLAWKNHPAVKMWRGYEGMLAVYGGKMCKEWVARGMKDSLTEYFQSFLSLPLIYPPWMTDEKLLNRIISTHRSSLLFKDETFYRQYFPTEEKKYGYYWPT